MDIGLQESWASDGSSASRVAELTREAVGCETREGQETPPAQEALRAEVRRMSKKPKSCPAAGGKDRVCGGLEAEKGNRREW